MTDKTKRDAAETHFRIICDTLDSMKWKYTSDSENLTVKSGTRGEDLPIELTIHVVESQQLILVTSHLPFTIAENKRIDAAIGINAINHRHVNGFFDFDINGGHIFWRINALFADSLLSEDTIRYLILVSAQAVDIYNNKFFMLSKGMLSIEDLLKSVME